MSDPPTLAGTMARDPLEDGHAALGRHDWSAAFDALSEADEGRPPDRT